MKLLKIGLLFFAFALCACQQATEVATTPQTLQATATASPAEPVATEPVITIAPQIQIARILRIERPQGLQSTEARFAVFHLKKRIPPNADVTLIPLGVELAALNARLVKVASMENPCSESLPQLFETELAPITEKAWLTAVPTADEKRFSENEPFEVCLIYPAVAGARALNRGLFDAARLPKKVPLANIVAALDTNGDDQPEVLLVEYCCDKPQAARGACDLTCSAVYVRDAKGQWRIVETQTPC